MDVDVTVVGSGPNGLAAAVIAARAGLSVRLIERNGRIGGGLRTSELTLPGFRHDVCSAVHPMALASPFFRAWGLARRVRLIVPDVSYAHPLDGAIAGVAWRDLERTAAALGRDGPAWRRLFGPLVAEIDAVGDITGGMLLRMPKHPQTMAQLGLRALVGGGRGWNVPFADAIAPALLTGTAAHMAGRHPSLATAAVGLVLGTHGHGRGWPIPEGGSQAIADALAADLVAHGGKIVLGVEVNDLGDVAGARAVLLDVGVPGLLAIAGDRLPGRYRAALNRYRFGPGVCKVDFALSEPVPWAAPDVRRAGTVHLGGTRAAIAAAREAGGWLVTAPLKLERGDVADGGEHRDVLEAYRMFANDQGWQHKLHEAVATGLTAEAAVERVQSDTRARMLRSTDPYLRERLHDLEDLGHRLMRQLVGQDHAPSREQLPDNAILIARAMGPAALLDYDRKRLRGLVLEEGTADSHVSIVARALGIPAVGEVPNAAGLSDPGDAIIVDGTSGSVYIRPSLEIQAAYAERVRFRARRQEQYRELRDKPCVTKDGQTIDLMINAGLVIDLPHIDDTGSAGIGLFRTELQFMVSQSLPRTSEQLALYRTVLDAADSEAWFAAASARIGALGGFECALVRHLRTECVRHAAEARQALHDSEGLLHRLRAQPPGSTPADAPGEAAALHALLQTQAERLARTETELQAARRALSERKVIERAKGMLMARLNLSEEAAFRMLQKTSMDQNRRLLDVAEAALALPDIAFARPAER